MVSLEKNEINSTMAKCRACLVKSEDVVLFDENIASTYNILTNLCISEDDGLPQHLCKICSDTIYNFGQFRERCICVDAELRAKIICAVEVTHGDTENTHDESIKIEEEFDYDNIIYYGEEFDDDEVTLNNDNDIIKNEDKNDKKLKNNERQRRERKFTKKDVNNVAESPTNKLLYIGCGLCPKIFENEDLCKTHLLVHKEYNKCSICSEKFKDWWQTLAHRSVHESKGKFCYICRKRYHTATSLEYHYRKMHSDEKNIQMECNVCFRKYKNALRLRKHQYEAHSDKIYICDYCQKICTNRNTIKIHMRMHLPAKLLNCKLCDFTCKWSTNLKSHMLYKHTVDKVYCGTCTRWFPDQKSYDTHKCSTKKSGICPVCGKEMKCRLKRHLLTHSTVAQYKCDRCPAVYKNKASLREHVDKHDGIRRKKCEFCPMAFYSGAVLIKHRRIHTGIKPYVCKICQKAFTGNFNLKVHMKVHGECNLITKKIKPDASCEIQNVIL